MFSAQLFSGPNLLSCLFSCFICLTLLLHLAPQIGENEDKTSIFLFLLFFCFISVVFFIIFFVFFFFCLFVFISVVFYFSI